MAAPPIKDPTGRPAIELIGSTADDVTGISVGGGSGGGICIIGAEFGDGLNTSSVVAGEYGDLPRIPFELDMERWEVLAYDASGSPLAISCVIAVEATTFATNAFAAIDGTERPFLSSEAKHDSTTLLGWTMANDPDTMYRFTLISFTGSPAKIVLGIRCFAP